MSLNAAAIRLLAEKGLSALDIAEVAECMEATKPRSANAERQARYRERQKEASVTNNVTRNATDDNSPALSRPLSPQTPLSPTHTHPETKTRARKGRAKPPETAMPEGWRPVAFGHGSQSREIVDGWSREFLAEQIEHFAAHHRKLGSRFADWQAAWSTWVLNSRKFGNGTANRRNNQTQAGSRDGFLNACFDAAMGGNGTGDPFGRAANQARSDSAPAFPQIATGWNG